MFGSSWGLEERSNFGQAGSWNSDGEVAGRYLIQTWLGEYLGIPCPVRSKGEPVKQDLKLSGTWERNLAHPAVEGKRDPFLHRSFTVLGMGGLRKCVIL